MTCVRIFMALYAAMFFGRDKRRLQLLVRQNDEKFNEHIKFFLGDVMELENSDPYVDLLEIKDSDFDGWVRKYGERIRHWLNKLSIKWREAKNAVICISVIYASRFIGNVIAKYHITHIYKNGGLYDYAKAKQKH